MSPEGDEKLNSETPAIVGEMGERRSNVVLQNVLVVSQCPVISQCDGQVRCW